MNKENSELSDLKNILKKSYERGDKGDISKDGLIRWLVELPMSNDEYFAFREIVLGKKK